MNNRFYTTYQEAKQAVQVLGIKTSIEYTQYYKRDPKLPSNPHKTYKKNWRSWKIFLGRQVTDFYSTLQEISQAVKELGITSSKEYFQRYKEDPKLPSNPQSIHKKSWKCWQVFLGKKVSDFYATIQEASQAAQERGINTCEEYFQRYKEDPHLPSAPPTIYAKSWECWQAFLGKKTNAFYVTYQEASIAAQSIGIKSRREYYRRYKEDSRLPSEPRTKYSKDWQGFQFFLHNRKNNFYATCLEASLATQKLGITTSVQYKQLYKKDPRLPSNPQKIYSKTWQNWACFLNKLIIFTYQEASHAAQALGITTIKEYLTHYKEDPRLPSNPKKTYAQNWQGFPSFLNQTTRFFYRTYQEASYAAQTMGITTKKEYKERYKEDPCLPSEPKRIYAKDWQGIHAFLGKIKPTVYVTYQEACHAAKTLDITSYTEYKQRYREDLFLPSNPSIVYAKDWKSWPIFLDQIEKSIYDTYQKARLASQKIGITSYIEYKQRYKEDFCLPSCPDNIYAKDWQNWKKFLLPDQIYSLKDFKNTCKILGIKSSQRYKKIRKHYSQLPSKPEKKIIGWKSWYDSLEIPTPYQYEILRAKVQLYKCNTLADYSKMRDELKDPRIPSAPEETYKNSGWTNTFDFFGKPRPYQVEYFTDEWIDWTEKIKEFLRSARGGGTKAKDLCEFTREYIQKNDFEPSPLEYLTRSKINIHPMLELLERVSIQRKKKWLFSINEFLNWIIVKYLTIEDDNTGEISRVKGAKNPFEHINFDNEKIPQVSNETNKLALPYQFVKSGRDWIFPQDSIIKNLSYSDLRHLQTFPADWKIINNNFNIDKNDPDCITKTEGGKTYLWIPTYWTHTYALMQLPARGVQIAYCDSGEADSDVASFKEGKLVWEKNLEKLAGITNFQGMINKTPTGDFGVYYTSNKTSFGGNGYAVPFMPEELAYWLIKLRKWQQKYNPVTEPTSWFDCKRTNLNELQRKHKGVNCFLFRDYKDIEPGTFGGRLSNRLAASLYFSAKDEITNSTYKAHSYTNSYAELEGRMDIALYHFKSLYTPHSMRVSLINAYAYEFGVPLEVIMKLVGHSSIIMSIYYIKSDKTGANIKERMELGEKKALKNAQKHLKSFINQQRIEECKNSLIGASSEFTTYIDNNRPASSYLFKDFGICPVGGAFCSEGGSPVATKANIYHPVPAGYLGEQNCIHCRFFITGPAFMVGLAPLFNEISLAVNTQSYRYENLEEELLKTVEHIEVISHELYEKKFNASKKSELLIEKQSLVDTRQKLNSEIETRAKKLDLYMSDLNGIHRHLTNCQKLLKQDSSTANKDNFQLIVSKNFQINCQLEDVSSFQQLSEVCENAELYHSCSDELAVTRRSQALDKMMMQNDMLPQLFLLTEQEQLIVGNQLTQLMYTRLNCWKTIDKLIDGGLILSDLSEETGINVKIIQSLFSNSKPLNLED